MQTTIGSISALMTGKIITVETENKTFQTGYFKETTDYQLWLGETKIQGDFQADTKFHGGKEKALLAYGMSSYTMWKDSYGFDFGYGSFGENISVSGLDEESVCLGDTYKIGEAIVQVSQPRQPCWKINVALKDKNMLKNVLHEGRTGWYYRVIKEEYLQKGALIALQERPNPDWSVKRANDVMKNKKTEPLLVNELLNIKELSDEWKKDLK